MGVRLLKNELSQSCDTQNNIESFGGQPILPIPMVKVLDEEGNVILRGWYMMLPTITPSVGEYDPNNMAHVVVYTKFSDFGMPTTICAVEVTPPHKIVFDSDNSYLYNC